MNKFTYGLMAGVLLLGSQVIMADSGVVVHEKNGNSTFFPATNIDYVEFVENFQADGQVQLTSNIKNLTKGETLNVTAVVTAQSEKGLILTDNAGSIFYYNNNVDLNTYAIGTIVKASGTIDVYGTGFQLPNSAQLSIVGSKTYTYPVPTAYSAAMVTQAVANTNPITATYITLEGELNISGNYYNINIAGCAYQGSLYTPIGSLKAKLVSGESYKFTGYYTGITNGKYFYMVLTDVESLGSNTGNGQLGSVDGYEYPLSYVKLPAGTAQQVKEYTGFTVNFNKDNHTPNYVAWELTSSETSGSADRSKYTYWVDNSVEGCLNTDYAYSTTSYERGHMCPAADQKWSEAAMKDCMAMTNMVPQLSSLNGGMWATLENKERDWANRDGAIWIVAGPLYTESDKQYIGKAQARVPSACFKAILYYNGNYSRAIAFVMTNGSNPGNLKDYAMSIDDLEKELGYDLFSALPDDIETKVEASFNYNDWN